MKNNNVKYFVWITAITPLYAPSIISGLINKGYTIDAHKDIDLTLHSDKKISALISFVCTSSTETNERNVMVDLASVLKNIKAKVFSVIVAEQNHCTWSGSNIDILNDKNELLWNTQSN